MDILNPFSKRLDKFERGIAVFLDSMIVGVVVLSAFFAEEVAWELQTETIYKSEQLIECIHSDSYYSTWRTSDGDTVAVYNEHNVHVHNIWCCHPITCEGTRVIADSVPAIPTKLKLVKNSKSCTYHWERKRMWNW